MQLPSTIAGRYRVLRMLGRGGMGAVYLVEHVHTGEHLALKVLLSTEALHPAAIERFKREARAPAKIRSENVVRVTDADVAPELGGAPFMVMEALEGKDLEALVKERGAFAPLDVAWILSQVGSALDKAHAIGIVHRDLKPENLFLHRREDGSDVIKILDFGISKMREQEGGEMANAGLTQTGAVMGTPLYMSPEQARGQVALIGPTSDVWALGLVAYRLLSGEIYWKADSMADLMVKMLVEPLTPPSARHPRLGPGFDQWFLRSCERDPRARFASIGEQIRAFEAIVSGISSAGTNVLPLERSFTRPTGQLPSASSSGGNVPTVSVAQTGPEAKTGPAFHSTTQSGALVQSATIESVIPPPISTGKVAALAIVGLALAASASAFVFTRHGTATPPTPASAPPASASVPTPVPTSVPVPVPDPIASPTAQPSSPTPVASTTTPTPTKRPSRTGPVEKTAPEKTPVAAPPAPPRPAPQPAAPSDPTAKKPFNPEAP